MNKRKNKNCEENRAISMYGNILLDKKMTYVDDISNAKMTVETNNDFNKVIIRFDLSEMTTEKVKVKRIIINLKDIESQEGFYVNVSSDDEYIISTVESIIKEQFYPIIMDWVAKDGIANILLRMAKINSPEEKVYAKYLLNELIEDGKDSLTKKQIDELKQKADDEKALSYLLTEDLIMRMEAFSEFDNLVKSLKS